MPTTIGRRLHLCLSMLKRPSSSSHITSNHPQHVPSTPTTTTASPSVEDLVFANFNSLYDSDSKSLLTLTDFSDSSTVEDSTTTTTTTMMTTRSDLSNAIATRRLLLSSPGRSNSIVDSLALDVGIGVAIPTYSPDPYREFRRSMEEMAAAMGLMDSTEHRERLYELLLCYLALNRKHAHQDIVRAFSDLLAGLQEDPRTEDVPLESS